MGGTAKAIQKLYNATIKNGNGIPLSDLELMIKVLTENPEDSLELIADVAPKRQRTLIPGMAVLSGVMKKMGCSGRKIYSVGVREGFMETILNDDSKPEPSILDIILGSI